MACGSYHKRTGDNDDDKDQNNEQTAKIFSLQLQASLLRGDSEMVQKSVSISVSCFARARKPT
jgi:hypothetical protein